MKRKYLIITIAALVFIALAAIVFRPVPTPDEKDCLVATGTVTHIYEGGVKDVVFVLKGHEMQFYINRGLEYGLDLDSLRSRLTGQEVTIKYPDYWSPLVPDQSIIHISKLVHDGQTVFSEID